LKPVEPEKPFTAPWEAEAFAMVVKLHEGGYFSWSEWADVLGAEIKVAPDRPYYESWLEALELMVESKGLMGNGERLARIEAWDKAARATPHGQPISLENAKPSFGFKVD
jgi:nitrile hydratase accessory protein